MRRTTLHAQQSKKRRNPLPPNPSPSRIDRRCDKCDMIQCICGRSQMPEEKPLTGLWRRNPATPEGKYLVKRRDGSVVEWPSFVLGAKDPAAPAALEAYAAEAERLGMNPRYVMDLRALAFEFRAYKIHFGSGDPDRGRHRKDDPETIEEMRQCGNS
jgi:hypothetical protein